MSNTLTIALTPDPHTGRYNVTLAVASRTVSTSLAHLDQAIAWAQTEMAVDRRIPA